jgi:hypothetical protein
LPWRLGGGHDAEELLFLLGIEELAALDDVGRQGLLQAQEIAGGILEERVDLLPVGLLGHQLPAHFALGLDHVEPDADGLFEELLLLLQEPAPGLAFEAEAVGEAARPGVAVRLLAFHGPGLFADRRGRLALGTGRAAGRQGRQDADVHPHREQEGDHDPPAPHCRSSTVSQ